jgi:SAM-dependent methyltransferase
MTVLRHCQSCASERLESFFSLAALPVHSCLLMKTRKQAKQLERRDLQLSYCRDCGFVQNSAFEPEVHNYSPDYEETQAFSGTFNSFAASLAERYIERYDIRGKRVMEIGCGKGEFLVKLCELGQNEGLGIDPGYRPERTQTEAKVRFVQDFFDESHGEFAPDVLLCRHTLEHIAPVHEFMQRVRRMLGPESEAIVLFELPAVERVLEENAFEDIYYEHCSYFSLGSLARLFRSTGFEVLRLETAYDDQYLLIDAVPFQGERTRTLPEERDLPRLDKAVEAFQNSAPSADRQPGRRAARRLCAWRAHRALGLGEQGGGLPQRHGARRGDRLRDRHQPAQAGEIPPRNRPRGAQSGVPARRCSRSHPRHESHLRPRDPGAARRPRPAPADRSALVDVVLACRLPRLLEYAPPALRRSKRHPGADQRTARDEAGRVGLCTRGPAPGVLLGLRSPLQLRVRRSADELRGRL